ncbi:DUF397 domain-containing protein [Actinomadura oligospora]|uniref:DUF397 domain-containing protein n=1 Tax=Actinomadura oligospora TaxID=111804 RepID=UPI00047E3E64|nr:DUF397 domain-containing protein [Actinomadura oligospora]
MSTPDWSRATWRKSRHSGGDGNCVELARLADMTAMRDSKDANGPKLVLTQSELHELLASLR